MAGERGEGEGEGRRGQAVVQGDRGKAGLDVWTKRGAG